MLIQHHHGKFSGKVVFMDKYHLLSWNSASSVGPPTPGAQAPLQYYAGRFEDPYSPPSRTTHGGDRGDEEVLCYDRMELFDGNGESVMRRTEEGASSSPERAFSEERAPPSTTPSEAGSCNGEDYGMAGGFRSLTGSVAGSAAGSVATSVESGSVGDLQEVDDRNDEGAALLPGGDFDNDEDDGDDDGEDGHWSREESGEYLDVDESIKEANGLQPLDENAIAREGYLRVAADAEAVRSLQRRRGGSQRLRFSALCQTWQVDGSNLISRAHVGTPPTRYSAGAIIDGGGHGPVPCTRSGPGHRASGARGPGDPRGNHPGH